MKLLSGPVQLREDVRAAFAADAIPHRSGQFDDLHGIVRDRLREMTDAFCVALLFGSGTLANDAIAAHLRGRGLILVNGEFGRRLVHHANGARLDFDVQQHAWGEPLALHRVKKHYDWIWAVHCETSTGTLNDIDALKRKAGEIGSRLVLDCVSSLGAVPVDLKGVHLASAVSGKALAAPSGVAIVFGDGIVNAEVAPYLDLGRYWTSNPFTFASGPLAALRKSLDRDWPERFATIARNGAALRRALDMAGWLTFGDAPHVITVQAIGISAAELARYLKLNFDVEVAEGSAYLRARNWVQFCLMGDVDEEELARLIHKLERHRAC